VIFMLIGVVFAFSLPLEFEIFLVDTISYFQMHPHIALANRDTLFLTWTDFFASERRVFCAKSVNGGFNFLPPVEPDPANPMKAFSSVAVYGANNPCLVWSDYRFGDINIRFAKSNNEGMSFLPSIQVTADSLLDLMPQVNVSRNGQLVVVAWTTFYDTASIDSVKLFISRSLDGGSSFSSPLHIGGASQIQQFDFSLDMSRDGDTVAVVWEDASTGQRIMFAVSFDSGASYAPPTIVDPDPAGHSQPSLVLFADSVYVAYTDNRNGNPDIRLAKARISNAPGFTNAVIDSEPHLQDQPSLFIDKDGNTYISYRSEELLLKDATFLTILRKGNPVPYKDYIGVYGARNSESSIAAWDTTRISCAWEYSPDSLTRITVFARSVPAAAPGPPQNLLANGGNPSPWDTLVDFRITFMKPYDPSEIALILFKLGSPPTHNFDTTKTVQDTFSSDSVFFMVRDTVEGSDPLFVWLMDGRGYVDFNNNSSVLLRMDRTPPTPTVLLLPDSNSVVPNRRPFFQWRASIDSGGAGMLTYIVALDTIPGFDTTTQFYSTGLDTQMTLPDTLWDDEYFWSAIPIDSAGNWQFLIPIWNFHVRATPPPVPFSPPNNGWVARNFLLMWHTIPDPFAYVEKYFFDIATDSLFSTIVIRDSTASPQDTVVPVNNWTVGDAYWRVRARNLYGISTKWSPRMFFQYDTIPPPSPVLLSPVDGFITNNPRPLFYWNSVIDTMSGLDRYGMGVFSNPALTDTVFIDATPDTFTTPGSDLPDDSLYWVVLAGDNAGNISDAADTFLLVIDTQPPQINTVIPSDGQVGVSVSTNIIVTFSEMMDTSTFYDSTFIVIDNFLYRYYGTFQFNASFDQLTFDPDENFYGGRNILVTIKRDVTDLAGNLMISDYTWQFIIESVDDSLGPVLSNISFSPDTLEMILTATVSDTGRGNSMIAGAEYFIDSIAQDSSGMMCRAVDDTFDYVTEDVIDTVQTGSIPYLSNHWLYIHGLDAEGNWGPFDSLQFWIRDTLPPQIVIDNPLEHSHHFLGRNITISITANKAVTIDTCYIIGSDNNVMAIDLERDSLDTDSTQFSTTTIFSGLESGNAMLSVQVRDRSGKTGSDSVSIFVDAEDEFLPKKSIYSWPNPASDEVHFRFYVNRNARITIDIFTITGRRIATLTDDAARGGARASEIVWRTDNVGSDLYIFRLTASALQGREEKSIIKRFAIVK